MFDTFISWMFQPNAYNDVIVALSLLFVTLILGMIFNKG
jgi:hypothetical protein